MAAFSLALLLRSLLPAPAQPSSAAAVSRRSRPRTDNSPKPPLVGPSILSPPPLDPLRTRSVSSRPWCLRGGGGGGLPAPRLTPSPEPKWRHVEAGIYLGCRLVWAPPEHRVGHSQHRVLLRGRVPVSLPGGSGARAVHRPVASTGGRPRPAALWLATCCFTTRRGCWPGAWPTTRAWPSSPVGCGPLLPRPEGAWTATRSRCCWGRWHALALAYAAAGRCGARPAARAAHGSRRCLPGGDSHRRLRRHRRGNGPALGQDGGVVQLPLAIDKILAGESPYGADYSGSMLGRQARVSSSGTSSAATPSCATTPICPGRTS